MDSEEVVAFGAREGVNVNEAFVEVEGGQLAQSWDTSVHIVSGRVWLEQYGRLYHTVIV